MGLHDIHAHLTDPRLLADEAGVIERARAAGVTTIVSNGLHPADNQAVLELSRRHPEVKPAFGLYPVHAVLAEMREAGETYPSDDQVDPEGAIAWLESNVDDCVAIGEIGLDHYWVPAAFWTLQEQRFLRLVKLALDVDKPIIIHSRKAEAATFELLKQVGIERVNWHCYSSKVKRGRAIAAHGHWISIPAHVRRAENFTQLLKTLPRDKVLLETDCPYLSPDRDQLNEPANVGRTLAFAAECWDCTEEKAADQLAQNFEALMGFAP